MNRTKLKIKPAYIILALAVLTYIFQIVIFVTNENNYAYDAQYVSEMAVDYVYSQQRGSSAEANEIPESIYTILKLYRNFK